MNPEKSVRKSSASSSSTSPTEPSAKMLSAIESQRQPSSQKERKLYQERIKQFEAELSKPILNINKIRALAFDGIPEPLRGVCWRVLLNFLPTDRTQWPDTLNHSRKLYQDFKRDLIVNPHKNATLFSSTSTQPKDVTHFDHPLNTKRNSQWQTFFKNTEMIMEIDKDVRRTFPHLHFFQTTVSSSAQSSSQENATTASKTSQSPTVTDSDDFLRVFSSENQPNTEYSVHYVVLKRLLFIWAKLNPGIGYVQGMNEIVAPIYYVFASDPDLKWRAYAEEDTFFCFTNLMSEIRDNFCKSLDDSQMGIVQRISQFHCLLQQKDPQLYEDLEAKKMNPQFYAFRWLTLLLSQEFELPDVLRLWDTLFSDTNRFEFLYYVCVAMLVYKREELFEGDFADNLKLLQQYPPVADICELLTLASKLKDGVYTPPVYVKKNEDKNANYNKEKTNVLSAFLARITSGSLTHSEPTGTLSSSSTLPTSQRSHSGHLSAPSSPSLTTDNRPKKRTSQFPQPSGRIYQI
jgi:hypothetical protein